MLEQKVQLVCRNANQAFAADKFWKEILPEGVYVHPVTKQRVPATREFLDTCVSTFKKSKDLGLKVHFADGHSNKATDILGWVEEVAVLVPDDVTKLGVKPKHNRPSLWGVINVDNPEIIAKIGPQIQDVSAYLVPEGHPELTAALPDGTNVVAGPGLSHVAATPKPVIGNQQNFIPIAADKVEGVEAAVGFELTWEDESMQCDNKLGKVADEHDRVENLHQAFMTACAQAMYGPDEEGKAPTDAKKAAGIKKAMREYMRMLDDKHGDDKENEMSAEVTPVIETPTGTAQTELSAAATTQTATTPVEPAGLSIDQVELSMGFEAGTLGREITPAALDKHPRFVALSTELSAVKGELKAAHDQINTARLDKTKARLSAFRSDGRITKAIADKIEAKIPASLDVTGWSDQLGLVESQLDLIEDMPPGTMVPAGEVSKPASDQEPARDIRKEAIQAAKDAGLERFVQQ